MDVFVRMQPHAHRNVFCVRCDTLENERLRWMLARMNRDRPVTGRSDAMTLPMPPTHLPTAPGPASRKPGTAIKEFEEQWQQMTDAARVRAMFKANLTLDKLPRGEQRALEALRQLGVRRPSEVLRAL